ncbi:FlgD immunoglobulin-like domain containing protein [Desulfovibrio cuneatus]|uniref:FlgD immunoglobulin-like domain containing protein n=1 Tax=Desulfovibrio cuneatus TaxID=159728 RepID=UPI000427F114|nr:FlgD immunoglobulin-like domain containing protein [Desulfovibrio cuneatus]
MAPAADSILGEYEKGVNAATGGNDRIATDKSTFLKLLIAQLTHQDPMNPAEDKEFIAQLAQFTSVEELQNINAGIEKLTESQAQQQLTNTASLLGNHVVAKGDYVTKRDGYSTTLYAKIPEKLASCTINVYATNPDGSLGTLIRSEQAGALPANDSQPVVWDGKTNSGVEAPNGTYSIVLSGKRADGSSVLIETESEGTVIGVRSSKDGNHELFLNDGRTVRFNDVNLITQTSPKELQKPSGTGTEVVKKSGASIEEVKATLEEGLPNVSVAVYKSYADYTAGNLVYTKDLGAKVKGDFTYTWDGKDSNGVSQADGNYIVVLSGTKEDGSAATMQTQVTKAE